MAVQIEGPRFSTRISVGDRPSEKTPFCFGRVTGVSFGTGEALDAMGFAWDAFRTVRVGNWTRFVCRQRCMNSSALLGAAMILPFMTGQVYRGRVPGAQSPSSHAFPPSKSGSEAKSRQEFHTYPKAHDLANVGDWELQGPQSRPTGSLRATMPTLPMSIFQRYSFCN